MAIFATAAVGAGCTIRGSGASSGMVLMGWIGEAEKEHDRQGGQDLVHEPGGGKGGMAFHGKGLGE